MPGSGPQVGPNHYGEGYDGKARFASYWHQIREVLATGPATVLEVGVGTGLVAEYLRRRGVRVVTADIDPRLGPDALASVTALPFADGSFDTVLCSEVLEHIPFEALGTAAREIRRVSRDRAIISVPDASPCLRIQIGIPGRRQIRTLIPLPSRRPEHRFDGEHHWEIGKRRYPLERITAELRSAGLELDASYRVFEKPYHRFFRLRVRGGRSR